VLVAPEVRPVTGARTPEVSPRLVGSSGAAEENAANARVAAREIELNENILFVLKNECERVASK